MKKRVTGFALSLPFLLLPLAVSCASGGIEPIEIDLSAKKTPTPAAVTPGPAAIPAAAPAAPIARTTPAAPAAITADGPMERVVRDRTEAFNRADLGALAAAYASDARIYDPPDRVRDAGADGIRAALARELAASPRVPIAVADRQTQGSFVVQRETRGSTSSLVVYEIRVGRIANVWILR